MTSFFMIGALPSTEASVANVLLDACDLAEVLADSSFELRADWSLERAEERADRSLRADRPPLERAVLPGDLERADRLVNAPLFLLGARLSETNQIA